MTDAPSQTTNPTVILIELQQPFYFCRASTTPYRLLASSDSAVYFSIQQSLLKTVPHSF